MAAPGCYPTAAALALAPLVTERPGRARLASSWTQHRACLRGRSPAQAQHHVLRRRRGLHRLRPVDHRHTPEIEQSLARLAKTGATSVDVLFTPHLAPMSRGILATCYLPARPVHARAPPGSSISIAHGYADEPFVVVTDASPSTKATLGANTAHVTVRRR